MLTEHRLRRTTAPADASPPTVSPSNSIAAEMKHLTKRFGRVVAVSDVSLDVRTIIEQVTKRVSLSHVSGSRLFIQLQSNLRATLFVQLLGAPVRCL